MHNAPQGFAKCELAVHIYCLPKINHGALTTTKIVFTLCFGRLNCSYWELNMCLNIKIRCQSKQI